MSESAARVDVRRGRAAVLTLADILNAPELAVLNVLAHAVHVARVALIAQYPHLLGDPAACLDPDGDPIAQAAFDVLERAFDLSAALRRYERQIDRAR